MEYNMYRFHCNFIDKEWDVDDQFEASGIVIARDATDAVASVRDSLATTSCIVITSISICTLDSVYPTLVPNVFFKEDIAIAAEELDKIID